MSESKRQGTDRALARVSKSSTSFHVTDQTQNLSDNSTARRFSKDSVRFAAVIAIDLERDTHVVVVAAGQGSKLGLPMGQRNAGIMPIAVSNPIFVDVDGGGFSPNHDRLGVELPIGAAWPEASTDER